MAVLAVAAELLGSCAGAEAMTQPAAPAAHPAPAAAVEVGLNPGETMAFEVRLAGIVAGEAQLAVGELGDYQGHRAVVVKSRAATAGAAALIRHSRRPPTTNTVRRVPGVARQPRSWAIAECASCTDAPGPSAAPRLKSSRMRCGSASVDFW